ncbi:uncharacterized protein KD926_010131 [Aspergillus affinis]|uniref:uncharacterized protein n=1 Tax=Aspergillus affinis TaxID=1070780 RepID=UPI0022FE7761|nr:uncharacterized protein KD926_010131 [Aspergillus affinis]KAI9038917.1 hypothetical protein KD926_010131 [Aspergillus affinis]
MIPPCDPAILESNPQFKRLHQHLTTTLLHPDGSTRTNDTQPARKAALEVRRLEKNPPDLAGFETKLNKRCTSDSILLEQELKNCRIRHAKKEIKKQTLRKLAFDPDSGVSDEDRDPVAIVSLYLDSSPRHLDIETDPGDTATALTLLAPDIDAFYSNLAALIPHFSKCLSNILHDLRKIANAGDPTSSGQSTELPTRSRARGRLAVARLPPLSSRLDERARSLRQLQLSEIPAARARMAATATEVVAARAAVMERTVVLLERAKHGALARATKAKAEHLATVAQGVEGKLSVMKLDISATIYTPETVAALGRYRQHLQDTREGLEERQALAREELRAYEDVDSEAPAARTRSKAHLGSGPMREIARRYGTLLDEIEEVRSEIQRLRR